MNTALIPDNHGRAVRATCAALLWLCLTPCFARANDFYVAPNGNDSSAGTEAAPFATMQKGQAAAAPGDTVFFRAGNYVFKDATAANGVILDKSGQSGKPINYWAYPNELPVFDFSGMTAATRITGLRVSASWISVKGLELKGVPQNITTEHESWGIYNTGSNNVYEALNLHHHMGPGLFIAKGGNNLVLNCDSHHNYDPKSSSGDGTNADGFGCHSDTGNTGNVFRGCRAWWNTDDGYDLIQAQEPVIIEKSWAWNNGYQPDTMTAKADGNGFKGGGYGLPAMNVPAKPPVHTIRECLAFQNRASGFYANHHPVGDLFYNNTAFRNRSANYNMLGLDGNVGVLRNNVAYGGTTLANDSGIDATDNSWNLPTMLSDNDFESVDMQGADAPRKPDGSLPDIAFMKLRAGSALIDKGKDVGLPFAGAAPDLGAFETGLVDSGEAGAAAPSGGSGSAGVSGSAGAGAAGVGGARSPAAVGGTGGGRSMPAASGGSPSRPGNAAGSGGGALAGTGAPRAGNAASIAGSGAAGSAADPTDDGGCSCNMQRGGGGGGTTGVVFAAWLILAAWRRQRRRSA